MSRSRRRTNKIEPSDKSGKSKETKIERWKRDTLTIDYIDINNKIHRNNKAFKEVNGTKKTDMKVTLKSKERIELNSKCKWGSLLESKIAGE